MRRWHHFFSVIYLFPVYTQSALCIKGLISFWSTKDMMWNRRFKQYELRLNVVFWNDSIDILQSLCLKYM